MKASSVHIILKTNNKMRKQLMTFVVPALALAMNVSAQDVKITIHANQGRDKINKEIYGQFAETLWRR